MYQNERKQEILSILSECTYATVAHLANSLHISASSIRRDLSELEADGMVVRSYGGAELSNARKRFVPFSARRHKNSAIKRAMAETAATYIKSGDVVLLDDSSSAYFTAEKLCSRKDITVITSGVDILFLLSQSDVTTYSVGGLLNRENRTCLTGSFADSIIRKFHADWCIFSVKSLDDNGVLSDCVEAGVAVLNTMMACAEKNMFLCDSSKLGSRSTFVQCEISDLNVVISNTDIPSFLGTPPDNVQFVKV